MRTRSGKKPEPSVQEAPPLPAEEPPVAASEGAQEAADTDYRPPRRRRAVAPQTVAEEPATAVAEEPSREVETRVSMEQDEDASTAQSEPEIMLGAGFDAIVETLFKFDAEAAYERIKKSLQLDMKPSRAEYGMLVNALDEAEEIARLSLQMLANCKLARKSLEAEVEVLEGSMREEAQKQLRNEGINKPTIADVQARMVRNYHDTYRHLQEKKAKASATLDYIEGLTKVTQERARDLRAMVSQGRP